MCISVRHLSDSLIIKKFHISFFESQYLIVLFSHLGPLLPSFKSEVDSENFNGHNGYGPVREKTEPNLSILTPTHTSWTLGMTTGRFGKDFGNTITEPEVQSQNQTRTETHRVLNLANQNQNQHGSVFSRTGP